jgi:L-threonylcarbamoyladenylate synthase
VIVRIFIYKSLKMKSNTLSWSDSVSLRQIVDCLQKNKVILAPSDTVWGLCGMPTREVFEALNRLKVRNDKPYLLLARSLEEVKGYAYVPQEQDFLEMIKALWPGPLTIIFKAKETAPDFMVSKDGSIAFRIPKHQGLQALLRQVPVLFSTSANISGHPVPVIYAQVDSSLKEGVALAVVPEGKEEAQTTVPSTIIDVSQGAVTIVREGAIPVETIKDFFSR